MKKLLFPLLSAILCFAACEQLEQLSNGSGTGTQANRVAFSTSVGAFTKATETAFEEGDLIGISALSPINKTNVCYTFRGDSLSASDPICWAEGQSGPAKFVAMYPYKNGLDPARPFSFEVSPDQSNSTAGSDLLAAVTDAAEGTVRLAFTHKLSKIVVSVEGVEATSVTIVNVPLSVNADILAGTFTATSDRSSVRAHKNASGKWEAIVAPHTSYAGIIKVVAADGKTYEFNPSGQNITLASGVQVSATVTPAQTPVPQQTAYTYSISDWQDGGNVSYTSGAGEDLKEHDCYLSVNDEFVPMDYAGNCVWSITREFNTRDYCVIFIDNRFIGRGFETNYLEFDGVYRAEKTLYYWIPSFPCKATVSFDYANEKISISYEDTWQDAGSVKLEGAVLQGLGFAGTPAGGYTAKWQKNKYAEGIYRVYRPFDYLKGSVNDLGEGHIVLEIVANAETGTNDVGVLHSVTGLQYEFWPEEDPGYLAPVSLDGLSVYGTKTDNVISFGEDVVVVQYLYDKPEGMVMNSAFTLTILN